MLTSSAIAAENYGVVELGEGKSFQTGVFNPRYIGQLPVQGKSPYLIFSGRGCQECDANNAIYIHSPDDGPMLGSERDPRYEYPGRYRAIETGRLARTVRMFIGQCLTSTKPVVLWFESYRAETGKWVRGVYVAEVISGRLETQEISNQKPTTKQVLVKVGQKTCRELKGVNGDLEP